MAPKSKLAPSKLHQPHGGPGTIHVSSQQSRFHTETLDTSLEIDIKDVSISIGDRELLSSVHLRLKQGVRYGLMGRNGSGKSTLLAAIARKLIPGLNPAVRILLLSQVEDSTRAAETNVATGASLSVLEHVIRGDTDRLAAVEELQGGLDRLPLVLKTSPSRGALTDGHSSYTSG